MQEEIIFLVQDKTIYFFPEESACQQLVKGVFANLAWRRICINTGMKLPGFVINARLRGASKIIMTDTSYHKSAYRACCDLVGKDNVYLYFLNVIRDKNRGYMDYFNQDHIATFDKEDAKRYGIKYIHTPYSRKFVGKQKNSSGDKSDLLFLGRDKGRGKEIKSIYDVAKKDNMQAKFLVLGSEDPELKIQKFISYTDYIGMLQNTKAVLEINNSDQAGCSLRFMEALFFQKKLVTNNQKVIQDAFYDKENTFVVGVDALEGLTEFLQKDYQENEAIKNQISKLDLPIWLKEFNTI